MLKQRYISCLVNLNKNQIDKGIKEIESTYNNHISFDDTLESIHYRRK